MGDNIRHNLKIIGIYFVIAGKIAMRYRVGTFFYFTFSMSNIVLSIVFINIIFGNTTSILGWSKNEVLLLYAFSEFTGKIVDVFSGESIWQLQWNIYAGRLDNTFLLPANSQLILSVRNLTLGAVTPAIISFGILIYTIGVLELNTFQIIILFLLIPLSSLTWYSIYYIIATFTFYIKHPTLLVLGDTLVELPKFPLTIFLTPIRYFLTFVLPIAFLAFIPCSIILHRSSNIDILLYLTIPIIFFFISKYFWSYSTQKYISEG